ncbi:MAG: nitroreductase family protein [Bacteroidota bacterium]
MPQPTDAQPYTGTRYAPEEALARAQAFYEQMDRRRSLRFFSDRAVDRRLIELVIQTASTAPSGAHKQPWTFVAISRPQLKRKIRIAAEKEEYDNYHGRMSDDWLEDLAPFGTDWQKPFLETVPWLIVLFKQVHGHDTEGNKTKHYYVNESMGIAAGMLITAIHNAGLVTLTHTPSPMTFLDNLLGRPRNERAFLLLPVGYPADDAVVPKLKRKGLDEMSVWFE